MEIVCGGNAVGSERMSRESASVFTREGGRTTSSRWKKWEFYSLLVHYNIYF